MPGLLDRRILFVGGKGGVGKTTTAAALGVLAARRRRRCLIVSTDPAHSLGDLFGYRIGDRETVLPGGVHGLEIDPDAAADAYIATVKQNMRSLVRPALYAEIDRQMDLARLAPGAVEAALLERVAELMLTAPSRYELLIFDTAPTGHTLRLLTLPESMAAWTDGLLRHRQRATRLDGLLARLGGPRGKPRDETGLLAAGDAPAENRNDRIRELLLARRRKFHRARRLLLDDTTTGFLLVLNPEKLPILESRKALDALERFEMPVVALVVNRVLPDTGEDGFFAERKRQEATYLDEIATVFSSLPHLELPMLPHDVQGAAAIDEVATLLASEVDRLA